MPLMDWNICENKENWEKISALVLSSENLWINLPLGSSLEKLINFTNIKFVLVVKILGLAIYLYISI